MKAFGYFLASSVFFVWLFASAASAQENYSRPMEGKVHGTPWWTALDDPVLTELIEQGLNGNLNLDIARSRIDQSRAVAWKILAPALPQISIELSGRQTAIEFLGANTINQLEMTGEKVPDSYQSGTAYLVGRLDLDIFGKKILSHIGARADSKVALANRDAQAASLAETIARTYYEILAARARVDVVNTQIKANNDLLELVQLRYERGDAQGLDVLQQKQQLATTRTLLPLAEALLETYEQQLAVLLGRLPHEKALIPDRDLPEATATIPTGQPADLAVNSPNMKSAEAALKAEKNRKRSAVVNFLPTIGLYGQTGEKFTDITEWEQDSVWEVGATVSIPLFQGGSNLAGYRSARATEVIARNQHRKATLDAIRNVENALIKMEQSRKQLEAFRQQQDAAALAFSQSRSRYLSGLTTYQTVLTSLTTQQQAQLNVIEAKVSWILASIDIADSVGGPWTTNLGESRREDDK